MNIKELKLGIPMAADLPKTTDTELQNEYNYILAENFTKKLLDKELISEDEFNKIIEKNVAVFSPLFSRIQLDIYDLQSDIQTTPDGKEVETMKQITKIEATNTSSDKKLRVAAYARVSTGSNDQLISLEAQKNHYERCNCYSRE